MEDYVRSYRILGVRPGDSWQELRTAYKSAVRKWHPDRFAQNHPERKQAEEQIKEINRAYQALENYYKKNGVLPPLTPTQPAESPITPPPPEPAVPEPATPEFPSANGVTKNPPRPEPATDGSSWWLPWVVAALLMFLSYILITPADKDPGLEAPDPLVMPNLDQVDAPSSTKQAESGKYLAVGLTLDQVYALLGTPTRTSKNHEITEWHYGDAIVFFRADRVTDWIDSPDHRLAAVNPIASTTATAPPKTFQRNSTRDEVRAAQGTPIRETDTMWDYGQSQVFFQHGRVIGWHESPLHPLKIQRDPQAGAPGVTAPD